MLVKQPVGLKSLSLRRVLLFINASMNNVEQRGVYFLLIFMIPSVTTSYLTIPINITVTKVVSLCQLYFYVNSKIYTMR